MLVPLADGPLSVELISIQNTVSEYVDQLSEINKIAERAEQAVEQYNDARYQLFLQRLEEQGLRWCNCCNKLIPKPNSDNMKYLFQKGITRSDSEYTDIDDSTIIFSFACSDCYQEAFDNSGGTYTTHRVEKRKDGFYYMLSEWRPIPKEVKTDFRPFLSEEWEKEFNIPPEIRFDDWSKKLAVGREEASLR